MQKTISIKEGVARHPLYRFKNPINLDIMAGEHIAITGDNGSGKSMLVDILTEKHPLLITHVEYDFAPSKAKMVSDNIKYITFRDSYGTSDGQYYYQQRWNQHDVDDTPLVGELLDEAYASAENNINSQKDISDEVIYTMAMYDNICSHIHLPVQSGSNAMLEKMRRKYTREWYLGRVAKIRSVIPDCGITTDIIAGFCGETAQDHRDTLSLMEEVGFDSAFMFQYSERPGTLAARKFPDDVPEEVKTARLNEIIALQNRLSLESNRREIGKTHRILIEGVSKKNGNELFGRAGNNKVCVFPAEGHRTGEYVHVRVLSCTSATLISELIR